MHDIFSSLTFMYSKFYIVTSEEDIRLLVIIIIFFSLFNFYVFMSLSSFTYSEDTARAEQSREQTKGKNHCKIYPIHRNFIDLTGRAGRGREKGGGARAGAGRSLINNWRTKKKQKQNDMENLCWNYYYLIIIVVLG